MSGTQYFICLFIVDLFLSGAQCLECLGIIDFFLSGTQHFKCLSIATLIEIALSELLLKAAIDFLEMDGVGGGHDGDASGEENSSEHFVECLSFDLFVKIDYKFRSGVARSLIIFAGKSLFIKIKISDQPNKKIILMGFWGFGVLGF